MARQLAKCGTDGGYYRHLRTLKTEPCQECRDAHAKALQLRELGIKPVKPEPKRCPCGKRILSLEYDRCSYCRQGKKGPETRPQPQIKWEKDSRGIMRAVSVFDPEPDAWPRRGWEQVVT